MTVSSIFCAHSSINAAGSICVCVSFCVCVCMGPSVERPVAVAAGPTFPAKSGAREGKAGANPEEVSGAAVFLASQAGSYITGQVIVVDGGYLAHF